MMSKLIEIFRIFMIVFLLWRFYIIYEKLKRRFNFQEKQIKKRDLIEIWENTDTGLSIDEFLSMSAPYIYS